MHTMLKIGNSPVMMTDSWPGAWERGLEGAASASLGVYVEDCDAHFNRAASAGCELMVPLADALWSDRKGKDHYGLYWSFATHQWDYTPGEM